MRQSSAPTDMLHGKPLSLLVGFAIPLLIGNLFQQMYNIVDSLIVGNFLGTQALAAVSIGSYPLRVLLALFMGLGTGATIKISHHVGAGNPAGVRRVIQTSNCLLAIICVPLTVLGVLVSGPILRLMRTPADTLPQAAEYLAIVLLGSVSLLGYNLNAGILRGLGDSRSSLIFLVLATFINIGLDLLFVAVFGWGIAGAAIATAIAMTVAWLSSLQFLRKRYPGYAAGIWPLKIDREAFGDILRLGLPIGFNEALFSLGHLMLSSLINTHGSAFAAGYSVGTTVDAISFMPIASFASATTTFIGQNAGAGRLDRIRQGSRTALLLTFGWNILACVLMLTFGHQLAALFDRNPAVIEVGYAYILRLEPFYWIYGMMFIVNAVMNGAGEVRVPMLSNLVLFWVIRLPVAYLLSANFPPDNIFFCYPISWLGGLLVAGGYYLRGKWRRHLPEEVPL